MRLSGLLFAAISLSLLTFVCICDANLDTPAQLNSEAIRLAQNGDLISALPLFEQAILKNPDSAQFNNNLGVTLMRLGRFEEALIRFERALTVEPNNIDALDNRIELRKYMDKQNQGETSIQAKEKAPEKTTGGGLKLKPRLKLPRVSIDELYSPGFEDYALGRKPFLLIGAMDDWTMVSADNGTWSLDFFKREFGHYHADFYPHNMKRVNVHPYMVPLSEALKEFQNPSDRYARDPNEPGTYIQWNVPSKPWRKLRSHMKNMPHQFYDDERWIDVCLPSQQLEDDYSLKLHWRMVTIGQKNAGMFFHLDVLRGSSWQGQVQGAKRWTLCDPIINRGKLYSAGEVNTFAPDLEKYPRFADSVCYDDVVRAGEMVFYPREYWHQTLNLATPSVSVSGTVVDENNYDSVQEEITAECKHGKWNWHFGKDLCKAMDNCFTLWNHMHNERSGSETKKCQAVVEDALQDHEDDELLHDEL